MGVVREGIVSSPRPWLFFLKFSPGAQNMSIYRVLHAELIFHGLEALRRGRGPVMKDFEIREERPRSGRSGRDPGGASEIRVPSNLHN